MRPLDLLQKSLIFLNLILSGCDGPFQRGELQNVALLKKTPEESSRALIQKLGEAIFTDDRLSEPKGVACASCHDPEQAFTGNNRSPIKSVAMGSIQDRFGVRNSPTAMYASHSPHFMVSPTSIPGEYAVQGGQFWDGRAATLVDQAKGPFLNPKEMNNPSPAAVVAKIAAGPYANLFKRVFGRNAFNNPDRAYDQIAQALAAYETSLQPFNSKFDAFLRGEEELSFWESWGFSLFKDPTKGNCLSCHAGKPESRDPRDWLFTDFTYDALGVPRNPEIPANQDPDFYDLGLCQAEGLADRVPEDFKVPSVCGAFKVPTLRNIAQTAPYMHNGVFKSLKQVVRFYVTRETHPQRWYPRGLGAEVQKYNDLPSKYHENVSKNEVPYDRGPGQEPRLNEHEIDAVVSFLRTLSDRSPDSESHQKP